MHVMGRGNDNIYIDDENIDFIDVETTRRRLILDMMETYFLSSIS